RPMPELRDIATPATTRSVRAATSAPARTVRPAGPGARRAHCDQHIQRTADYQRVGCRDLQNRARTGIENVVRIERERYAGSPGVHQTLGGPLQGRSQEFSGSELS